MIGYNMRSNGLRWIAGQKRACFVLFCFYSSIKAVDTFYNWKAALLLIKRFVLKWRQFLYVGTKSPSGCATHTITCPPTTLCQTITTVWKALFFFFFLAKWKSISTMLKMKLSSNQILIQKWVQMVGEKKKSEGKQFFFSHKPSGWYTKHRIIIVTSNLVGCFPLVLCKYSSGSMSDTLYTLKSLICIVLHFHSPSLSSPWVIGYGTILWKKMHFRNCRNMKKGTHNLWSSTRNKLQELKKNKQMICKILQPVFWSGRKRNRGYQHEFFGERWLRVGRSGVYAHCVAVRQDSGFTKLCW